ncbi:MAG: uracil-DNA glycosylase [Lachnospiraceae bacterium]|nr:uracil-DNA glycosylase [Lachnospiraceae bacterium]
MGAIDNDWLPVLQPEFGKPYYRDLFVTVGNEYKKGVVYPPKQDIFNAFHFTSYKDVKVLILGQDPYHGPGQAHGLCFSVLPGADIPPSLKNIYKELSDEYGYKIPNNGYLKKWADQGVLMLNTILTVRAHSPMSHKGIGWETFTDAVIKAVNDIPGPVVIMLWGRPAGEKRGMLDNPDHLVLTSPHPSPLSASRGFFGCGHFKKANDFLTARGVSPIDWQIEDI